MSKISSKNKLFTNKVIDKRQLKWLMSDIFNKYGSSKCAYVADRLKILGFRYATQAGLSLNIEDLRVPDTKKSYLKASENYIQSVEESFARADITSVDRFQYVIDKWSSVSDKIKDEVVNYFVKSDPFNPIYMMAFSGARGNLSQVRQLIGMRGLMADPQGQLIGLPIKSNFREGLTVTEYIISSYGARKGIVDTALRTADSGYLTRRLVDVSQDIIIRSKDCFTDQGILVDTNSSATLEGRTVLNDILDRASNRLLVMKNDQIDQKALDLISRYGIKNFFIRSSITCQLNHSVCQLCYGWNLATRKLIDLGEAVGILAAQSIGEPGTQLTMRTFHTGGTFMGTLSDAAYTFSSGHIRAFGKKSFFKPDKFSEGEWNIKVKKDIKLHLQTLDNRLFSLKIPKNSSLAFLENGSFIKKNQIVSKPPIEESRGSEQVTKRILSDKEGVINFDNLMIKESTDKNGNNSQVVQNNGFIWVCSSKILNLPSNVIPQIREGDFLSPNKCIMKVFEKNAFEGFCPSSDNSDKMLLASYSLSEKHDVFREKAEFFLSSSHYKKNYKLSFTKKLFSETKQLIGEYTLEDPFKSASGRIKIQHQDLYENSARIKSNLPKSGSYENRIFLVPEYYFESIDISKKIFVKAGDFVDRGYEIFTGNLAEDAGIVDIVENSNDTLDIILRPGLLFEGEDIQKNTLSKLNKKIVSTQSDLTFLNSFKDTNFVYIEQLSFDEGNESFLISKVESLEIQKEAEIEFKNQYKNSAFKKPFKIFEKIDILVEDDEIIKDTFSHDIVKRQLVFESNLPKKLFTSNILLKYKNSLTDSKCKYDLRVEVFEKF